MAERTEIEKAQEAFERKLKEQEMLLERQHQYELERIKHHDHEMRVMFEEQKKELLAQNDGLLGAVGRLHAENETLKKRVTELEPAMAKAKEEVTRVHNEAEHMMAIAEGRTRELLEDAKRDADRTIDQLKQKVAELQKRGKKS